MNKVISINIGGSIFQVEEQAFERLNSYLNELKKFFSNKPEGNEIITDIENRIAELLRAKISPMKAAINLEDVEEVTASMGAPKDFATDSESDEQEPASSSTQEKRQTYYTDSQQKSNRVYRDPDGRIIGGVCSGLGHYFKIDPVWIRLFFVIVTLTSLRLIFFGASPVLVYIILWIVIPEAKTTAEKLHMRKEKINIDNIQRSVQTEFGKVKDAVQSPKFQDQATSFFRKAFDLLKLVVIGLINIMRLIGKVFLYFLTLVFFVAATASLAGKVSFDHRNGFDGINFFRFFENSADKVTAHTAVFLGFLAFGFICLLLARGLSRFQNQGRTNFALRTTTIIVSVLAIAFIVIAATKTVSYFAAYDKIENTISLDSVQHHFYLRANGVNDDDDFPFSLNNDTLRVSDIEVSIEPTSGPSEIIVVNKAHGQNSEIARLNASGIIAPISVHDSIIVIPAALSLPSSQVYRKQEVRYKIRLHEGSKITVDNDYWRDIKIMQSNDFRRAYAGRTYVVAGSGIECEDCAKSGKSGNVSTAGYPLNINLHGRSFSKVKVSSDIHVKIIHGDACMIKAKGTSKADDMDINFKQDAVEISDDRHWGFHLLQHKTIELIIVTPSLTDLELSGVVQAEVEGFDEEDITMELSGTATCVADLVVKNLHLEQSGATKATLDGHIQSLEAEVSGASKLYASAAPVNAIDLHVTGASYAEVNATEKLEANASGASTIRYQGAVRDVVSKNSGASSVERMNQ